MVLGGLSGELAFRRLLGLTLKKGRCVVSLILDSTSLA